jgi:hypothetical protein
MLSHGRNFHQGILHMNITILDFAIIALPLVILISALLSRVRASLSRPMDEVSEAKKALRQAHIEMLRAKASRNLIPLSRPHPSRDGLPRLLVQAR